MEVITKKSGKKGTELKGNGRKKIKNKKKKKKEL
jgi:hypothetical protein